MTDGNVFSVRWIMLRSIRGMIRPCVRPDLPGVELSITEGAARIHLVLTPFQATELADALRRVVSELQAEAATECSS